MNVRSDRFLIARATTACPECAASTEVIALVLPPGHETDEPDEADDGTSHWMLAGQIAFLFWVERVSPAVASWLSQAAPQYAKGAEGGLSGLRNRCVRCGSVFDDQDLFCEPGGAFLPTNAAEAGKVSLATIDSPFEATIDGYAIEPAFVEFTVSR